MTHTSKILVTSATGLNGRSFLEKLTARGISVRAMVRDAAHVKDIHNDTTEIVAADFANRDSLNKVLTGIELAYVVSPIHAESVNYFNNFFMAAKEAKVRHIIKLSGFGAAYDSKSEILRQHFLSDELLINSGLDFTIIRPNSFYQNILWQKKSIKLKNRIGLLLQQAKQSMVDVRDVAEAVLELFCDEKHLNKVYQLTGPTALSGNDIASTLSEILGKMIKYKPISNVYAKQEMLAGGILAWNAQALTEIQEVFATGAYAETTGDLEFILNRKPTDFSRFLEDYKIDFC